MTLSVRPARVADVAAVLELWRISTVPSATDDEDALRSLLAHDAETLLVAEVDGRVRATLVAGFDGWRGQMYRLAVHPDERRAGVARRLVEDAESRLRGRGARRISALVLADDGARAFWGAVGYEEDRDDRRFVKTLP
ncbi:MAG TPA: GNAT family N-acetyltransferase [Acidimicrobiia bacterium]